MAFPQSSCLVQRWRCDLSLCPVQTKFRFPQFWLLDKSQFSSSEGALPSPLTEGLLAYQRALWPAGSLPQNHKSPALLASLQRKLPASHSPYYPAILTILSLGPFFVSFFHSPTLPCPLLLFLLARPSLLAMFCLLLSLPLSLLWTRPAASGCPLPNNYNKNLVLHHAMEPSCHWFTQYMTRPNLPTSEGVISILLN